MKYWFDVMDGSGTTTDRIQSQNIEGLENSYDVTVYRRGTSIYARHRNGTILSSGVFNTDDATVIQAALTYSQTISPKPLNILIKPEIYSLNATLTVYSNVTISGYAATLKWTAGTIAINPRNISNMTISGLTFDYNNVVAELRFQTNTGETTHNNLVQDCLFKNPLGTARLLSFINTTENWDNAINNRIVRCNFDGTEATAPAAGSLSVVDMSYQRNGLFNANIVQKVSSTRRAATFMNLPNLNMTISNNTWFGNLCDNDLSIQQQKNCTVMGNTLPIGIKIYDCRDTSIVGNNIRLCSIVDHDAPQIDSTYTSLFRGSQRILIASNALNSTADSAGGASNDCITITTTENDANPVKHIAVVGNSAKVNLVFFRFTGVNSSLPSPHENIVVSNNHILERVTADSSTGTIQLTGNTGVTNSGLKTCLIQGNYIGTLDTNAAGGNNDIRVVTTGFSNLVIRDNWFSNDGVSNINNYPLVFGNFISPTSITQARRDANSGTFSIGTGATSATTNHGLPYTPTFDNIKVVPTNSMGAASRFYVSAVTSTNFTVTLNTNPAGSTAATFAWHISRGSAV